VIARIVVPTLTRKDLLYDLLASIDVHVGTLLIIDNGRQELGQLWLPLVDDLRVADLGSNLGVAASWNLGIKTGVQDDWLMVLSDDVRMPPGALAQFAEQSAADRIVLSATWPHWCAFTIGIDVVRTVGLFDENFYPAYFEDNDYQRRLDDAGIAVQYGPEVHHANSSTLQTAGRRFTQANTLSFERNLQYITAKWTAGGSSAWDPYRWREQAWT
jgi:GT2 family glycosyltransferase